MIITSQNYKNYSIGSKAERLFQMMNNGMNVPDLFCVLPETSDTEILDYVQREFSDESLFSVRSSAHLRKSAVSPGQQAQKVLYCNWKNP